MKISQKIYPYILVLLITFVLLTLPAGAQSELVPERIQLRAAGLSLYLDILKDSQGNIFFPAQDMNVGRLMKKFDCGFTYLAPMNTL
ncbi:MAG: hypothetical protein ACLFQV_11125, partial [Vulcanimicrobiota bacterium]